MGGPKRLPGVFQGSGSKPFGKNLGKDLKF